ncbi:MAG: hypothetical protein PHT33_09295, partial [bacterium]|nr:hypothetical protein [bacterium]
MLFKHGNNSGQALIISVAVLAALLIMAQLFVALVLRNMSMDLSASDRETSLRLARDGVDYALAQLRRDGGNANRFSYEWGMDASDIPSYIDIDSDHNGVIDNKDGRVELSIANPYCPEKFKDTGNGKLLFANRVWKPNEAYSTGDRIAPLTGNDFIYYYEVTGGNGSSGGIEPTWPASEDATVIDGSLTLTCHKAEYDPRYGFCTDCSQIHPAYVKIVSTGYPYRAGTWQSGHDYSVGDVVRPPTANGWVYEVIGDSGSSGITEPAWTTKASDTVTDGGLTLASRVEVKSTIEAVAVVAPVFNNFLRFIGDNCGFTAEHGIYGTDAGGGKVEPAPLYVLGDVDWGTGIDLYLDGTNQSTMTGEHYPKCFFQALGRIKGAPLLIHTSAGTYDGTAPFASMCYFDKAHLPSYILGDKVIKGMGLVHWLNDGDFDRYKTITDPENPDLLALPAGEVSYIDNTEDGETTDAGVWGDTTGTGSKWQTHSTVDIDGNSEEVNIYSPPA